MFHVDVNRLNTVIAERNTTKEALAEAIGINRSMFYRSLKSSTLTIKDIHGLCYELNLSASDASAIFLAKESQKLDCKKRGESMTIGNRIKSRRKEMGMSQEELALKAGYVSRSSVNEIELGKQNPPVSAIPVLAAALHTTPAQLMGWD